MKRIACFSVFLILLFGCIAGLKGVASNDVRLEPEKIVEEWEFVGEICHGRLAPDECPETVFHAHERVYKNPTEGAVPEVVSILLNVDTDRIVGILWQEGTVTWIFTRYCGSDTWRQFSPDPEK